MQKNTNTLDRELQIGVQTRYPTIKEYPFSIERECGLTVMPLIELLGILNGYRETVRVSYSIPPRSKKIPINLTKMLDIINRNIERGSILYIIFRDEPPEETIKDIKKILSD